MKNFPSEYTYIDSDGKVWYKTYQTKKIIADDLNPYILSGVPVVINPETTVETLFDTINNNLLLKVNCISFDIFYNELKQKQEDPCEGNLVFSWDGISLDKRFQNTLYPMNRVYMEHDNKTFAIDLNNTSSLRKLKIKLDTTFPIYDEKDEVYKVAEVWPTLYQVIYGLFWELSFHGTPEKRDEVKEDLMKTINDIKNNKAELYSIENLKKELDKK